MRLILGSGVKGEDEEWWGRQGGGGRETHRTKEERGVWHSTSESKEKELRDEGV